MVNKNKIKGGNWEKDLTDEFNQYIDGAEFFKVAGSGALGTILGEPLLFGDVKGKVEGYPKQFRIECKTGYGGASSMTLKKEWLDKIVVEANASNAIPMLAGKFSGARSGVKHFIVLPVKVFIEMINEYTELKKELDALYWELENGKRKHMGSS